MSGWNEEYDKYFMKTIDELHEEKNAHDSQAKYWKKVDDAFMISFGFISFILVLSANLQDRFDSEFLFWVATVVGVTQNLMLFMQSSLNPVETKVQHIQAVNALDQLCERIKSELLQAEDERENADEFKSWINDKRATIEASSPYLFNKSK